MVHGAAFLLLNALHPFNEHHEDCSGGLNIEYPYQSIEILHFNAAPFNENVWLV
jgi:hypothetical protein